jgi:hypothetical protein
MRCLEAELVELSIQLRNAGVACEGEGKTIPRKVIIESNTYWSTKDLTTLDELYASHGANALSERLGRSPRAIYMKAHARGLTKKGKKDATKKRKEQEGRESKHQDGDSSGQAAEASRSDCLVEG